MGLANGVGLVAVIENLCAQGADIGGITNRTGLLGLTAAVYTTAGTSHDLNKVVICLTGSYLV